MIAGGVVAVSALLALVAPGVGAADNSFDVAGSVSFNSSANRTTTHFTFTGTKAPSDIRVLPCNTATVEDAQGPAGTKSSPTGFGGTGQTGVKFQPGLFGAYTVAFTGHVFRVDVVIVSGHQHTVFGLGNSTCAPAPIPVTTTAPPTTTTTRRDVFASIPSGGQVKGFPDGIRTSPAVVLGTHFVRATGVGSAEPAVQGTALAHTGRHTRMLLLFAGLALAAGGIGVMTGESRRSLATR
jgi:hypothetical protein